MKGLKQKDIDNILKTKDKHINKLNKIALDAVSEQDFLTKELYEKEKETPKLTTGDWMSDKVAEFGGSWRFIISFGVILFGWIILNALFLLNKGFDPYPFILLNLILSCIAAIQAPIIMMSQNRKEVKDRQRAENDYLINLKAEIEIRMLNQKIDMLMSEQMMDLFEMHKKQLEELQKMKKKKKEKKRSKHIIKESKE